MSTLTHNTRPSPDESERVTNICFKADDAFKQALDDRIHENKKRRFGPASIQELCFRAVSRELGIPVPGEEPEPRKRRAS